MTLEEFNRDMKLFRDENCAHDMYELAYEQINSLESKVTIAREFIEKALKNENEEWADTDYIKQTLEAIK